LPGFTQSDIENAVVDVWRGFAGLEVVPAPETAEAPPLADPLVSACITIRARWYGALVLYCPQALADRMVRQSLVIDEPEMADRNAIVGECVNQLAYYLKPHLDTGAQLSLPMVANGPYLGIFVPDAETRLGRRFVADDGTTFEVSVVIAGGGG
jgi:hypothetical protein